MCFFLPWQGFTPAPSKCGNSKASSAVTRSIVLVLWFLCTFSGISHDWTNHHDSPQIRGLQPAALELHVAPSPLCSGSLWLWHFTWKWTMFSLRPTVTLTVKMCSLRAEWSTEWSWVNIVFYAQARGLVSVIEDKIDKDQLTLKLTKCKLCFSISKLLVLLLAASVCFIYHQMRLLFIWYILTSTGRT